MLRRLLKPCPRCRGNHLLELEEENRHAVKCMQCGYFLLRSEMRFLAEDLVLEETADRNRTAA
jgi:Zn ribbon nucleic-acid-binding protein